MQLSAVEHQVLDRWAALEVARRVAGRMRTGTPRRPRWTGAGDPPAAAGLPGLHHVNAQAVLDTYQKLRTMQGYGVRGCSSPGCHGLPVEVAVERELGLAGLAGIEDYGAERFAARCREFALRHGEAFSALSTRLGCLGGAADAGTTMASSSIDTVWWSLRQIFDAGMLARSQQVTPYCPRCQTPLSVHDIRPDDAPDLAGGKGGQGLLVRLRLAGLTQGAHPVLRDADLVVWCVRPWTLVGTAAVAVHPHQRYALARMTGRDDRIIVGEAYAEAELGEDWHVAARISGAELAGASYYLPRILAVVAGSAGAGPVISGYSARMRESTGLVPVAPAYGADDLAAAARHDLPVIDPIGEDGRFAPGLPTVGGMFFADAEPALIRALSDDGALLATRPLAAARPLCSRCRTAVMTRALPVWSIRTTAIAGRLRDAQERIRWVSGDEASPDGPLANWVSGDDDWVVGRSRCWGTPLPLWECPSGHVTCVGGLAELAKLAGKDLSGLDPHRPAIDDVVIACSWCGAPGRRVPEVLDARYDAGWMALAGTVLPAGTHTGRHNSPHADLIVANAGQARGWLGALLTIGTLVSERPVADAAMIVGPILDDRGRPMSRSRGNLVEPFPLIERHGADAVRWCLIALVPAGAPRVLSEAALQRSCSMLAAYWDAAACLLSCSPDLEAAQPQFRPLWDRWILSELQQLIVGAGTALNDLRPDVAGARIESFVDTLASWYVRTWVRGRGSERSADKAAAVATLRACLDVLTRIMAPIVPFLTDEVWVRMREWEGWKGEPEGSNSVHLATWPEPRPWLVDVQLSRQLTLARRLAGLGRSARARARIEDARRLPRALVAAAGIDGMPPELRVVLADELNVSSLELSRPGTRPPSAGWVVATNQDELVALEVSAGRPAR